jgi:uncharacterized protein
VTNRLAHESSPYLRQHADNPVDWYPWGDEALAAARQQDRPLLISVGYSSCHWCHVMAHESFEDDTIAALMNELFINVKVDREERPDVDAVYMEAVQAMTGRGGWPMTVFATPDGRPFFAGTYFPPRTTGAMMGFAELCGRIDELWRTRRDELVEQATTVTEAIGRTAALTAAEDLPGPEVRASAVERLLAQADRDWGGFGGAPKFPQAMSLDLLARTWRDQETTEAGVSADVREVLVTSLDAMASGGMHDHLGGGFARYSVDAQWLVPHFEKMLYDQALLARAYLHGWQLTGEARFRHVLDGIVGYVLEGLGQPGGGIASAEDADSEGEEGRFYVWSANEFRQVLADGGLTSAEVDAAATWWGVTDGGNFEGKTILWRPQRGDYVPPPLIERARGLLFEARRLRVRPGLDDKVLTEWNALWLSALAEAAGATGDQAWSDAAVAGGTFLLDNLRRDDGRWLRSWQNGTARHLAYAADHAALIDAFVRLFELTGDRAWVGHARACADALLELFWDHANGGVFTTGTDAEQLVTRPKDIFDNATPSANSLAAVGLARLGTLTGESTYLDRARDICRLLGPVAVEHPNGFGHLLAAIDILEHPVEVVISGTDRALVDAARRGYRPRALVVWGEPWDTPLWEGRTDGDSRAWVCHDHTCDAPLSDPDKLAARLNALGA